jgi:3-hydroxyisobutyrate dehydrogenase-like beta-hydroxyacid dehydrogenase
MVRETVGMIGLGIMGSAMSANLMKAGFEVIGYDVADRARSEHEKAGGSAVEKCMAVASQCSIAITSLPSADALIQIANELAVSPGTLKTVIETSTLPIATKEQARTILAEKHVTLLDCPLSGTGAQARKKDLILFASGEKHVCENVAAVFAGFTRAHYYVGEFGSGSKTKFIANLLVAIHNIAAAEAMVLAMKSGLDPATTLKVVCDGAGTSRMLEVRGPTMVKNDYSEAAMKVSVWQKDMTVIADFARKFECPTPLFSATTPIYLAALAQGYGEADTASVCAVLEEMARYSRQPQA